MQGFFSTRKTTKRISPKWIGALTFVVFCLSVLFVPVTTLAQVDPGLSQVGAASGLNTEATLPEIIGRFINIALGFLGIILLGILVYAGFLWMTAGGQDEQVEKAKSWIKNGIIGLVIIVSAYAITNFIINLLLDATNDGGSSGSGSPFSQNGGFPGSAGSLGAGIVESHIPMRDATGVARNTSIVITFKEPIKLNTVIKNYNDNGTPSVLSDDADRATTIGINSDIVKVYPSGKRDQALTTAQARVAFTDDRQTFVIRPVEYLGSPTVDTDYTVEFVGGSNGLKLEDGTAAFAGGFSSGYKWQFQVSTLVDNTPPKLISVVPKADGTYAPNIVVQMQFDEPIDPISASGKFMQGSGFTNIQVAAGTQRPDGEFSISNRYQTVEFLSAQACGTNSCGNTVYCLPYQSLVTVTVKAPTLSDNPPAAALSGALYDGIVDLAGNAFDGDKDGKAQGSDSDAVTGNDDFTWTFQTTDKPNLDAPKILSTIPTAGDLVSSSNLTRDAKIEATFDTTLRSSTVNSESVVLKSNEPASMVDTFWWATNYQDSDTQRGIVELDHRLFVSATGTGASAVIPIYQPVIGSEIQNSYQNCYVPSGSDSCQATAQKPFCCNGTAQATACTAPTPLP